MKNAFNSIHGFIESAVLQGKNVLVNCMAGAHRAGTTGVSYLMKAAALDFQSARKVAKLARPAIDPFGSLAEALVVLEKSH